MTKPVIIFGAGASHDYVNSQDSHIMQQEAPPLTKDLFNVQRYHGLMQGFPELAGLVASLTADLRNGADFEESLVQIEKFAAKNVDRKKQLIALEFYLQRLFLERTERYGNQPANNYLSIVGAIRDNYGGACIITFNYDLLFEQNIREIFSSNDITSYIKNPIQVIKLHGSCNWTYLLSRPTDKTASYWQEGTYRFLMEHPEFLDQFRSTMTDPKITVRNVIVYDQEAADGVQEHYFPAIAIPLAVKDEFICPKEHISEMEKALSQADHILIVGWKAGDKKLIEKMQALIKQEVTITVVGGPNEAEEIAGRLSGLVDVKFNLFSTGRFSNFITSPMYKEFFYGEG